MKPLELFIGPCVVENKELCFQIADHLTRELAQLIDSKKIILNFKGSFDKANRTSSNSFRGDGMEEGLRILEAVKKQFSLPLLTDFHLPSQAEEVAKIVDTLQIPAFLCRQTDMIEMGAKAVKKFNGRLKIKKGQFLSPYETKNIVDKAEKYLSKDSILLTERGSSFGYNYLVVDMSSFQIMQSFGVKVIHDATHCVQRPGALGNSSGGAREFILPIAKAAIAAGADGIFMETHPTPERALSDPATSLALKDIKNIVHSILRIYEATHDS